VGEDVAEVCPIASPVCSVGTELILFLLDIIFSPEKILIMLSKSDEYRDYGI
jgi:hypothetical protein